MAAIAIKSFNHTGFTVADLDRAVAFFTEVLGFTLRSLGPRDPKVIGRITGLGEAAIRIAFVDGPGHTVELLEYASPPGGKVADYRTCDIGAAHIALNVGDIAAAVAACEAWGWRPMGELVAIDAGPNKGRLIAYLRHPDGIILEFIQEPQAAG